MPYVFLDNLRGAERIGRLMTTSRRKALRTAVKVATAGGSAVVGGAVGTAMAGPAGGLVGTAAGALVQAELDTLGGWVRDVLAGRQRQWWERIRKTTAGEKLQDLIRERAADPNVAAAVLESLRAVNEVLAPDAIPPLADLVAAQFASGEHAGSFFRGMTRLLRDVTTEELVSLREIVCALHDLHAPWDILRVVEDRRSRGTVRYLDREVESEQSEWRRLGQFRHVRRTFFLLKNHGLAFETESGTWGAKNGPHTMAITTATVRKAAELLVPSG